MKCKYYRSKEEYYGVDGPGGVPPVTHGFWECEPTEDELREAFIEWRRETMEPLEPDHPSKIPVYCEECGEDIWFDVAPKEVFTLKELVDINIAMDKELLMDGEIDDEDFKEAVEYYKSFLKGDKDD